MTILNDTTAIVYDTDGLRDAVSSDNGIDYVYLGADITLAYGITIYPQKPSLTIDGTYQGVTYTFTDMNSSSDAATLGVRAVSNIEITIKNIRLTGRNYYGIPFVQNGSIYNGVSIIYINVVYNGTQLLHNPYGYARFIDCDITVNNHEVGEISRLEIGGTTTLKKTNTSNAVFWFYGSATRPSYMRILADAAVEIDTNNYFMYETYPPDYIIEPGASLTLHTRTGIADTASHTVASFLVDENAVFHFTQRETGGNATLYITGPLTVNPGAVFYMEANFTNNNRLIWFSSGTPGLYINNPRSFALYNSGNNNAKAMYFASQIPVTLSGGQLNYWEAARPFPTAGTFEDEPYRKWNRPGWGCFTLTGTASASQTVIDTNDFTPEELAELPPLGELRLHMAQVLSIGEIPLEVYSAIPTRQVTGKTLPGAIVKVVFLPSYYEDPDIETAGPDGLYKITPGAVVPFSEFAEVYANTPFLIVSAIAVVYEDEQLVILEAPRYIEFPVRRMTELPGVILPRAVPEAEVVVLDTRSVKTEWWLWANISGPLKTEDDDILDEGVVFILQNDAIETLTTELRYVHTDGPYVEDRVRVIWPDAKGVHARVSVPVRSGKKYTTTLGWAVSPANIEPEEGE